MKVDVVNLPAELKPAHVRDRAVVVFDVLRATTTMVTALSFGAKEIRIFDSLDAVRAAGATGLRCGELKCVKPADFEFGNSPAEFTDRKIAGKTLLMSTTNGTRAIVAARAAAELFVGAVVNAGAMAERLFRCARDVTLLCAGTEGEFSIEDFLGAGAVIDALSALAEIDFTHVAIESRREFVAARDRLSSIFRTGTGGRNILAAGLDGDIDFAARLDAFDVVGCVKRDPLRVEKEQ